MENGEWGMEKREWRLGGSKTMELIVKALAGAVVVVIIQVLAQTKNAYIAGLIPLFPTFALIAHYIVGTQRTTADLKETILFGMFSLIPYFLYLVTLYFLVDRFRLVASLLGATFCWIVAATILIVVWGRL
jgi:membrane protein GlpM